MTRPRAPMGLGREGWLTVRAAVMGGWGPTTRLVVVIAAVTISWVAVSGFTIVVLPRHFR